MKNILLNIDNVDKLKDLNVIKIKVNYRTKTMQIIIDFFFKKYRDKKEFDLHNWVIFKDGIIKNLYNKGVCNIKFIYK